MSFRKEDPSKFTKLTYPMITPLITSSAEGKDNVMPATWTTPISITPPLYGVSIGKNKLTHQLIRDSREFGVCFMEFKEVKKVLNTGRSSGKDIDKFQKFGLEKKQATSISAPLLKNAVSALECKVKQSPTIGGNTFFVGKVVTAWKRQQKFKETVINLQKTQPILYLGANTFCTTQEWDKRIKSSTS